MASPRAGTPPRPRGHVGLILLLGVSLCIVRHWPPLTEAGSTPSPLMGCDPQPRPLITRSTGGGTLLVEGTALEECLLVTPPSFLSPPFPQMWREAQKSWAALLSQGVQLSWASRGRRGAWSPASKSVGGGGSHTGGRSSSGQSSLQPECEMPGEECGEAAGAGVVGAGPWAGAERGCLGFLWRDARGPEGFKVGLGSWTVRGQGPRTLQKPRW